MIFKEMFHQAADYGVPSHWVVFYYIDNKAATFHEAAYFKSQEECEKFIKEECS